MIDYFIEDVNGDDLWGYRQAQLGVVWQGHVRHFWFKFSSMRVER